MSIAVSMLAANILPDKRIDARGLFVDDPVRAIGDALNAQVGDVVLQTVEIAGE